MHDGPTVSPSQASRELGVASRTLLRWVKEGKLQIASKTAGGHARFDRKDIEALRAQQTRNALKLTGKDQDDDLVLIVGPVAANLTVATSSEPRVRPSRWLMAEIERARLKATKGAQAQHELALLHDQAVKGRLGIQRSNLFALLWEYRLSTVAVAIGVSATLLRRICGEHDIPLPTAGYWRSRAEPSSPASPLPAKV